MLLEKKYPIDFELNLDETPVTNKRRLVAKILAIGNVIATETRLGPAQYAIISDIKLLDNMI